MHATVSGARVGLNSARAVRAGMVDGRADHRDGHALPAVAAPYGDAGDHPGVDLVDRRRRARARDSREVEPRSERDEADGLAVLVRDEARRMPPSRQPRKDGPAALLGPPPLIGDSHRALLARAEPREEVPARGAPGATRHGLDVVDARRGERSDVYLVLAGFRHRSLVSLDEVFFDGAQIARMVTRGA